MSKDVNIVIRPRRLRCYYVGEPAIETLFQEESMTRIMRGIPQGAKVLSFSIDYSRNAIGIIVEHPSFAEVPIGKELPAAVIMIEHLRDS